MESYCIYCVYSDPLRHSVFTTPVKKTPLQTEIKKRIAWTRIITQQILVTTFRECVYESVFLTGIEIQKVSFQHKVNFQMIHSNRLKGKFLYEK